MQKWLNEDATYFFNKFKKHPLLLVFLLFFIGSGIALFTLSLLCNYKFPCTDQQQNYSLIFGLNMCLITTVFIIIPCSFRITLNCIYHDEDILPVRTRSPLTSTQAIRSRSNSREKIPPSPKGPIPKHGMKSFKEYHSEV